MHLISVMEGPESMGSFFFLNVFSFVGFFPFMVSISCGRNAGHLRDYGGMKRFLLSSVNQIITFGFFFSYHHIF